MQKIQRLTLLFDTLVLLAHFPLTSLCTRREERRNCATQQIFPVKQFRGSFLVIPIFMKLPNLRYFFGPLRKKKLFHLILDRIPARPLTTTVTYIHRYIIVSWVIKSIHSANGNSIHKDPLCQGQRIYIHSNRISEWQRSCYWSRPKEDTLIDWNYCVYTFHILDYIYHCYQS